MTDTLVILHPQREDARLKKEHPTLNSKLRRKKISKLYAVRRRRRRFSVPQTRNSELTG